jgi:4-amino-4-deoxy-L-arabinose transferase-like glycosyltransferase
VGTTGPGPTSGSDKLSTRRLVLPPRLALPTWLDIPLIVAIAVAIRLAFFSSAPPFLNMDSEGYFVPARDLVAGLPFDLGLRRTPTYPLFIAAAIALAGENLQTLVTIQHFVFGPTTAVLVYVLGRLLTGRGVALAAALLTALSGPMLLYEHYVMTEAPFALLLLGTLIALVLAMQRASWPWAATAGLLFGLLVLCRPSAQVLAPLFACSLFLGPGPLRRRGVAIAALGLVAATMVLPWMTLNWSRYGTFAITGSGRFLLARTLKEDPGGYSFDRPEGLVEDATRAAARRIVQQEAARRPPGSSAQRLREELGLSEAEAYRIMGDLAREAILNRPVYYAQTSGQFFVDILIGRPTVVRREGLEWKEVDWERRVRPVFQKPIYPLDEPRAQALLSIYDPARFGLIVPTLFLVGLVFAAVGVAPRWLLLPGLTATVMIAASAALVGPEIRYRYPQDPLIALIAAQAIATGIGLAVARLSGSWRVEFPMQKGTAQ